MDKVHVRSVAQTIQRSPVPGVFRVREESSVVLKVSWPEDAIPSYMRNFQRTARPTWILESYNWPLYDSQAFVQTELVALGHQQLQSEANADYRFAGGSHVLEWLDQVQLVQRIHGITEGSHARQNHCICGQNTAFLGSDQGLHAHMLTGMFRAEKVPHAEIDYGNLKPMIGHFLSDD
jgi:hypothetical protein